MPSTFTPLLRLTKPGLNDTGWGTVVNNGTFELIDNSIAGLVSVDVTSGNATLTTANGATDEARYMFIRAFGASVAREVIVPALTKLYFVINDCTADVTFKVSGQTGVTVPASRTAVLRCNGTDVVTSLNYVPALTLGGNLTLSGGTANGVLYLNGSKVATSGSALTFNGTTLQTTGDFYVNVSNGGTTPALSKGVYVESTSNNAVIGYSLGIWEGTNNRRGSMFMDDQNGVWGWNVTASSGVPDYVWQLASSEQMRLTSTGLGIGAQSPSYKLDVFGASGVGIRFMETSSGNTTRVLLGTASGIGYIDADAGTGSIALGLRVGGAQLALLDSSGNLGLGVTPSAWNSTSKAIQVSTFVSVSQQANGAANFGFNFYEDAGNTFKYSTTDEACRFSALTTGGFGWYTAPSGTAGNAISFTQAMTLDASGNLGLGVTPSAWSTGAAQNAAQVQLAALSYNGASSTASRLTHNAYLDGSTWKYISSSIGAARYEMTGANAGSTHSWSVSAGGTAGNAISFTQAMTLDASGNLLVGTTNTSSSAGEGFKIVFPIAAVPSVRCVGNASTASYSTYEVYSTAAAAFRFYVDYAGTVFATNTTISAISDQRLKENIQDLDVGLNAVMALKPRKFDWKAGRGKGIKGDRGFIAQEFEQVFPDLIDQWKDPAPEGEEPYKAVRQDLIPVLVKAIQEQQAIINDLRARVAALEAK